MPAVSRSSPLAQLNSSTALITDVSGPASLAGTVLANESSASAISKQYDIAHSAGLGGTTFDGLVLSNSNFRGGSIPSGFALAFGWRDATDTRSELGASTGLWRSIPMPWHVLPEPGIGVALGIDGAIYIRLQARTFTSHNVQLGANFPIPPTIQGAGQQSRGPPVCPVCTCGRLPIPYKRCVTGTPQGRHDRHRRHHRPRNPR